jgi:cholesterol oxidase
MPQQFAIADSPKTLRFLEGSEREGQYAPFAARFKDANGVPAIGVPLPEEPYGNIFGKPRRTTCRMIGECDVGCNEGAKSSMDHTYLSKAVSEGASIHVRTEVRALSRLDEPDHPYRFEVSYVVHPKWAEGQARDTRRRSRSRHASTRRRRSRKRTRRPDRRRAAPPGPSSSR